MFLHAVYPRPGANRKQPPRRVGPVTRVKAITPIESERQYGIFTPTGQAFELSGITRSQNHKPNPYSEIGGFHIEVEQINHEPPIGGFYMQNILPVLLTWRRPKTVIVSDFIVKRHDMLRAQQRQLHKPKRAYSGGK